ncbi:hypothetical protein RchiOBHm_Chr3g0447441 [Rosa chinensis]|uniref:Uncharacterized protein n=1 Tax=Rosa chinensis TaxID=74649 RepID=A0A2P6R4Y0_ROSCH|nr:hypothetical protein RchiOBHm_Chr3g0447441 [Rosa chinensis]
MNFLLVGVNMKSNETKSVCISIWLELSISSIRSFIFYFCFGDKFLYASLQMSGLLRRFCITKWEEEFPIRQIAVTRVTSYHYPIPLDSN